MKKSILIVFLLFTGFYLFGSDIPRDIAEKVARNYYFQAIQSTTKTNEIKYENLILTCIQNPSIDESCSLYIFNINNDDGFVVVSSNDNVKPILAYSFESGFNIGNISPSQQYLLDYYSMMNSEAKENKLLISKEVIGEWQDLTKFKPNQAFKTKATVEGLLDPIEWNQSMPYNAMCPQADGTPTGYGGRCPVGCSAIAMLQIMKYYNWPFTGTGSYTHDSWDNGDFGDFTVNFGQNTYDWFSMPNSGQISNDELAKMCFHAGVAIKMHWSPQGSGASPEDVATALVNYFRYEDNIDLVIKDDYWEEDWKEMLRNHIDEKKPIFYVGYTDEAGHAWNCDGYQDEDYFHMNWGWGGYGNGFYTLDALGTSATPGNSEGNYNQWQHALLNIYPEGSYPSYCNELININGAEGSFDDGSSFEDYQSNSACTYVIEPECKQIIALDFTKFDLAVGDIINIWDGSPEDNNLLVSLDAENLPLEEGYEAISGKMTIQFNTDANYNSDGWAVSYSTKSCKASRIFTEPFGSFDDGSKDCLYSGATLCSWTIQPENTNKIYIDFEYFDLGENIDFVNIYKNSISTANLIESFNYQNIPTGTIAVNSEITVVRFFAGSSSTLGEGWQINYSSDCTGVSETKVLNDLFISPNPGSINSNIILKTENTGIAEIQVSNILGEIIGERSLEIKQGKNAIPISTIMKIQNGGMYLISIKFNDSIYSKTFLLLN